jgi:hypothetical protein
VQVPAQNGKRFVARDSELSEKQAERSKKRKSAAESGGAWAAAPTCDSKILKLGYTAATTREFASTRRLAERQRTAPQASPSAEWEFGSSAPNYFQM